MLGTFILSVYMCFCVVIFLHMYAFCSYWFMYISAYLFVYINMYINTLHVLYVYMFLCLCVYLYV